MDADRVAALAGRLAGMSDPAEIAAVLAEEFASAGRGSEEELLQAQKMTAIGRLAGGVAHDFNNILTTILGHAEFLVDDHGGDREILENAEAIRSAAERASAITEQLLLFSSHRPPADEVVDVNEVVIAMRGLLTGPIGALVEFSTVLAAHPATVRGQRAQLEQVVLNLVVNAADAMPEGGRLEVSTTSGSLGREPSVLVSVRDTGHGIPEDVRDRVFEPFFSTKESGTGLGLAVAYGIVEAHGGQISVAESSGEGTRVEVVLPVVDEDAGPAPEPEERADVGGTERVLLVEDEAAVRAVATAALGRHGYEVIEAADGLEALERFESKEREIDLLLTDIVMPHMSGGELAERLRQGRPDLRVLYMSGYSESVPEGVDRALGFVQKPFTPDVLLAAVRRMLDASASPAP